MTSLEKFKHLTDGVHNIIIIMAIVVGGAWTLYTFSSLGARQRAQDELFKQAVINISLDCKQQHVEHNEDYIQATVKIANEGKRNTLLDFTNSPFKVYRLAVTEDGTTEIDFELKQSSLLDASIVLRSGATQEYPFVVRVPSKGFYLVEFSVPLNDTEFKEHKRAGGPAGTIYWSGSTSIVIK